MHLYYTHFIPIIPTLTLGEAPQDMYTQPTSHSRSIYNTHTNTLSISLSIIHTHTQPLSNSFCAESKLIFEEDRLTLMTHLSFSLSLSFSFSLFAPSATHTNYLLPPTPIQHTSAHIFCSKTEAADKTMKKTVEKFHSTLYHFVSF